MNEIQRPAHDYLYVRLDPKEMVTKGGIIITEKTDSLTWKDTLTGTVELIGPGAHHPRTGALMEIFFKAGDRILFNGSDAKVIGDGYVMVRDANVVATLAVATITGAAGSASTEV